MMTRVPLPANAMMSGEQGLELSGAARNGGCVICPSDGESALLRQVRRGRSQVMRDSPVQGRHRGTGRSLNWTDEAQSQ